MKKNNKGFALAEILAVTLIVMVIFATLYANFAPLKGEYEKASLYNDVSTQYKLHYFRKIFMNNVTLNSSDKYKVLDCSLLSGDNNKKCLSYMQNYNVDSIILTKYNTNDIKSYIETQSNSGINNVDETLQKFMNYIKFLPKYTNQDGQNELYRIMIRINNGNDTYKYATSSLNISSGATPPAASNNFVQTIMNKVGTDGLVTITHPTDNTLQLGATENITEYRYQGTNPNNYVNFNGTDGDYRIIGVFPTEDEEGTITNRIKLIKTTYYDYNYWNNLTNNNKWGESPIITTLNDTYYNSLINKGLIDSVKYYLGGYNDYTFTNETMYQYERKISGSTYYYSGNPTSWIGQIGLMYVSDYMYGSADCNGKVGNDTETTDTRACTDTNWLSGSYEWTITELSSNSYSAFCVNSYGLVYKYYVNKVTYAVRPVQYLIPEAVITGGTGTIDDPYQISMPS